MVKKKKKLTNQCRPHVRDVGSTLGRDDPLEEEMATHSRILGWGIPWTKEPDKLQTILVGKELDTTEAT